MIGLFRLEVATDKKEEQLWFLSSLTLYHILLVGKESGKYTPHHWHHSKSNG